MDINFTSIIFRKFVVCSEEGSEILINSAPKTTKPCYGPQADGWT